MSCTGNDGLTTQKFNLLGASVVDVVVVSISLPELRISDVSLSGCTLLSLKMWTKKVLISNGCI
jgi:hypothetical protein